MEEFFKIKVGNCERDLPLIKGENVSYYCFNMMGDTELNKESAKVVASYIADCDIIVTIECKAIALAQEVSSLLGHKRYVIIRKSAKSYMVDPLSVSGNTIISGQVKYFLDKKDIEYLKNKKIAIVDDVVSTCGTIDSVYNLFKEAGLSISKIACVLCEGEVTKEFKGIPVYSYGFIPLMENKND